MNTKKIKMKTIFPIFIIAFCTLIVWTFWANTALELNTYRIESNHLPEAFDGFRIAHISDLHNAQMGEENNKLLSLLTSTNPDIIVITGDIIDSRNSNIDISLHFAEKAVEIAPCYYVTGNHEARFSSNIFSDFENKLALLGVTILHDKEVILEKDNAQISLVGIDDPNFSNIHSSGVEHNMVPENIRNLVSIDSFSILLSHRPEYFKQYVMADFDLVFSGHAHGGQFRLPLIGGLIAPHQGFFPEYDSGLYTEDNTNMIVSRGVGNSVIPLRFNNRPEIILVELKQE